MNPARKPANIIAAKSSLDDRPLHRYVIVFRGTCQALVQLFAVSPAFYLDNNARFQVLVKW